MEGGERMVVARPRTRKVVGGLMVETFFAYCSHLDKEDCEHSSVPLCRKKKCLDCCFYTLTVKSSSYEEELFATPLPCLLTYYLSHLILIENVFNSPYFLLFSLTPYK
jgi:hypothetical protein